MKYQYRTGGQVCAQSIEIDLEDGIVQNVKFAGGCPGNHLGIASLVNGMKAEEVITRLSGISCGGRGTSCPDQLARALQTILEKEKDENKK